MFHVIWSVLKFLLSQYTARLFGSIRLHVAQNSNWKTLGKNSFHIEDAGNFGFGHLSKPFVTFRPFSIAHEELQRTTKNHRAPFPNPLSFFVPLAGRIHRPSSGSTQIDDSTMTRWRNFHVVERHHNTCYSEILLRIRVLHVCDIIGVYYYFENSAGID